MPFITKYHDIPIILDDDNATRIQLCRKFPKTGDTIKTSDTLTMVCIKCIAEDKLPDLVFFPINIPLPDGKEESSFTLGECSIHGVTRFAEL